MRNSFQAYDPMSNSCVPEQSDEFYQINEVLPLPMLDTSSAELRAQGPLTPDQQSNYDALAEQLSALFASQAACPGHGNIDRVVNEQDQMDCASFAAAPWGKSSWYDFDLNGLTDQADCQVALDNAGSHCAR